MARRPARQMNQRPRNGSRYVSGNLAYDYDYLERERRREEERRRERAFQQDQQRRLRDAQRAHQAAVQRRKNAALRLRRRELQRISPLILFGFASAAAVVLLLLMSYAQLAIISNHVVEEQKKLSDLQEEHVALVARYERTFDLSAIKEAAEAAGMAKPSASQIYYVDLSTSDSVVLYQDADGNMFMRAFSAIGEKIMAVVEYLR